MTMKTNTRWIMMGLIIILVLINYIDRSAIAYAVGPISKTFDISPEQWGFISGAFSIGYLVVAFMSGALVDRFGPKKLLTIAVIVWSLASACTVVASTFTALFVVRILLGVGEGPGFPAATRATSRWLPKGERGLVLSLIGGAGVAGSLLIGGPIATQLILAVGWQGMFFILSAAGFVWLVLWLMMFKDDPASHGGTNAGERQFIAAGQTAEERQVLKARPEPAAIFGNVTLWMVALGFFCWGYIFFGLMYWLPGYLAHTYSLNLASVGWFSVIPWACGIVGSLIGGTIMDTISRRTGKMRPTYIVMGIAVFLSGASMIPVFLFHSLGISITFISLGVGFGFVTAGFWWVGSIEACPDQPGFAAGLVDACFGVSGIVAPIIMGFIVQRTGSFQNGFLVMFAVALIGAAGLVLFTRERSSLLSVSKHLT
jgi:sugar phosphate permease